MKDEDQMDLASLAEIIAEMQSRHGKGLMEDDDGDEGSGKCPHCGGALDDDGLSCPMKSQHKKPGSLAMIVSKSVGKKKGDESEEYK